MTSKVLAGSAWDDLTRHRLTVLLWEPNRAGIEALKARERDAQERLFLARGYCLSHAVELCCTAFPELYEESGTPAQNLTRFYRRFVRRRRQEAERNLASWTPGPLPVSALGV